MPDSDRNLSKLDIGRLIRSVIFFLLFYLYLWLCVDLRLIYGPTEAITNFPVFYKSWAFFGTFLSRPGGLGEYAAAFLSQFFYVSWAGALVVTLQAWVMSACVGYILNTVNLPRLSGLRFVPPILLLIAYTQYTYQFTLVLAFLIALLFACLYLRILSPSTSNHWRLMVFLILSVISYTIVAGAYGFFALFCVTYELSFGRRWWLGVSCVLLAMALPYVEGVVVFGVSTFNAYSHLSPFSWEITSFASRRRLIVLVYILYSFLPLTFLISGLWGNSSRWGSLKRRIERRFNSKSKKSKVARRPPRLKWIVQSLALFAIASAAIIFSYDAKRKTLFLVDYYACHEMWPQLIEVSRRHPNDYFVVHATNRALYHTGRLSCDMFSWPQRSDALFLSTKDYTTSYWRKSLLYLDIGLLNVAENALTESLEGIGERPEILKRLALIDMAKADYASARIYLGALSKTMFYDDWANKYLACLKSDADVSQDEDIQRLRSISMEKDYDLSALNIETMLLDLLGKNRKNRMAFEYLMSWYMLTGQLEKFVQNLDRLDAFGVSQFPPLYEEAMLIYVFSARKAIDLQGRQLSTESRARFDGFNQTLNRYGKDKRAAYNALAKDYSDSYFFYYVYGRQGTKR
jgi:hypothetical protein